MCTVQWKLFFQVEKEQLVAFYVVQWIEGTMTLNFAQISTLVTLSFKYYGTTKCPYVCHGPSNELQRTLMRLSNENGVFGFLNF